MIKFLVFIFIIISTSSMAEKVSFTLTNSCKDSVQILIEYNDPSSAGNSRELWSGYLSPNQIKTTDQKSITNNSTVSIYIIYKEGGRKKLKEYVVSKKMLKEPFTILPDAISLKVNDLAYFTSSDKIIEFDSSLFLEKENITPRSINGLYNQFLGGLAVYVDTLIDGKLRHLLLDHIDPIEMKTAVKNPSFGTGKKSLDYFIKSNNGINLSASFPGIAKGDFKMSGQSLYELKVIYQDCGVVPWIKDGDQSISDAFINNVSQNTHYRLAKWKEKYPNLRLKIIDNAYVLNSIYYELDEYQLATTNADVEISTFVTGSGNYSKEVKKTDNLILGASYLGYWFSPGSQDLTSLIDLTKGVILASNLSIINSLAQQSDMLNRYNDMRKEFSFLPAFSTVSQIKTYLSLQLTDIVKANPSFRTNKALQSALTERSESNSQALAYKPNLSDDQIEKAYLNLKDKNPELKLPDNINTTQKAKLIYRVNSGIL